MTVKSDHNIIEAKIANLFYEALNIEVPSASTDLFENGLLDSQQFVELLLHLEQQFDTKINIEDLEIDNFRCIENIANLVSRSQP